MKPFITAILTIMMIQPALAMDIIPSSANLYYPLGGGSDISMPPVTESQSITIGGDFNADLGFNCMGFNPSISIRNTLNNIKDSIQGIQESAIASATAAVGSMPMYFLSKTNKDLYNLLQNTMAGAQETFRFSSKSCQTALDQIKDGKSPYQDWFSISDSQGWLDAAKRAGEGQDVDVNQVKKQVTKDPEKYGMPWVHKHENSGGSHGDQVPIEVIRDVVIAGYNVLVDPSRDLDDETPAPQSNSFSKYWKTPVEAGAWAELVLGDITISSKEDRDRTKRGVGLTTLVQTCPDGATNELTCAKDILENMVEIVESHANPTEEQLRSISSTQMGASFKLIHAIRHKEAPDRAVAISKWSQDIALQNAVNEALLLRRMLIAGSHTKPVQNLKPALDMVERSLIQLDQEIKNIMYQVRIKRALPARTAQTLLNHQHSMELDAVTRKVRTQEPRTINGAVYK